MGGYSLEQFKQEVHFQYLWLKRLNNLVQNSKFPEVFDAFDFQLPITRSVMLILKDKIVGETVAQLRKKARSMGITGFSRMSKSELIRRTK